MPEAVPGAPLRLSPLVRRVLAPNPGVMTGPGTNTYLVGTRAVAVIDPGPDEPSHLDAVATEAGDAVRWILVTHTHPDHAPGARSLRERLGGDVTVLGFGARDGFEPDARLGEGDVVGEGFNLRALHTPGHASNHLCYLLEEEALLFSGDHIMNGSTVVISPPDGDMAAYVAQLARLRRLDLRAIAPGHGDVVPDAAGKIDEYLAHRALREAKVIAALDAATPATIDELVETVYVDVDRSLHPIARSSLWAHLRKLHQEGRATADDPEDPGATWSSVAPT